MKLPELYEQMQARYGKNSDDSELRRVASEMPGSFIAVSIPDLSDDDAAILASDLLQTLAGYVEVDFDHPNVLRQLGFEPREPRRASDRIDEAGVGAAAAATPAATPHHADDEAV